MPENYESDIRRLATNLRLGSSIASLYKEVPFKNPGEDVRDLLERIWEQRVRDRMLRNRQKAGFEKLKTLRDFQPDNLELPRGVRLDWFTECKFIDNRQNLILLGNPGTGKTHLATAIGLEACSRGYKVLFRRMAQLVEALSAAYASGDLERLKNRVSMTDLLIIDEWGYLPTNVDGTRLLFDLIANCYEKRSVILTTNLPIQEWNRIFSDERLLIAMIDRLVHHGYLIKHTGESYRLTHSLMRQ